MTRKNYYIPLLMLAISICSCKKSWLDEKTDSKLSIPSNLVDFQALLDYDLVMNTYSPGFGEIASDNHYVADNRVTSLSNVEKNAYTWSHEKPYMQVIEWVRTYSRIFYCNVILEGLERNYAKAGNQEEVKNIKGQALFQRARSFYEIAQIWAPPYNADNLQSEFGIPLRTKSDIYVPTTRSSLRQTYDQIISDLFAAKDLLPVTGLYKVRSSKTAVYALLARMYLSMGEYENARIWADSALSKSNAMMDFNTLSTTASFPIPRLNDEIIFKSHLYTHSSITTRALVDTNFYNSYHQNDLRKKIFFKINTDKTISFKGSYNQSIILFNGLAVDEMLLIRAECLARKGETGAAMEDLNTLFKSRWIKINDVSTYADQTAIDSEDALRKILSERNKELLLRGLRWSDLRRLNKDDRFKVTLTRTALGQTYTLTPNSYQYTFPIPDDIIQQTGMKQNPE